MPVKVTVNFDAGIVAGVDPDGWVDATRIASLARTADQLILQGVDSAVAWQLLIYEKSGVRPQLPTASAMCGSLCDWCGEDLGDPLIAGVPVIDDDEIRADNRPVGAFASPGRRGGTI